MSKKKKKKEGWDREELSLYKMLVIYRRTLMFTLTGVQHNTASAECV